MKDPYQTLGVSPTATDDEIKQAYRALAKKYHPDNYVGSPLADLASEKMAEINAAYDEINAIRKGASRAYGTRGPSAGPSYRSTGGAGQGQYGDVRRMLNMGRVFDAEQILDGVPASARDAEWFFLKGNAFLARGFLDDATSYLQRAVSMDPSNYEYRSVLEQVQARSQYGYAGMQGSYGTCGGSPCTTCLCTLCLCNSCCRPCY